jgi:TatD DNase family protein
MIIDSHCHLHDEKFADDLDEVLVRAKNADVKKFITIGCDIPTTKKAQSLAGQLPHIYFTAGFHPHEASKLNDEALLELKALAQDQKCVAIGEIGLDYYYLHSNKEAQIYAFKKQMDLAIELDLPVVIHLRDAFADCVSMLKKYPSLLGQKVVIHCFSGSLEEAKVFQDLGCLISLSGIITFKKPGDLREVAQEISLKRLLVETDCPYLAPHPYRGKRNEPSMIVHVLAAVAQARNEDISVVTQQIYQNARQFFNLPC